MSFNTFGHMFRVTTFGESHGVAIGCVVDGCPPLIPLTVEEIQRDLDRRRPGQSRFTTQRQEPDAVKILSGVMAHPDTGVQVTTGTPIALLIENTDQRSKDYSDIKDKFRPGHADFTYEAKYGLRDYRGGGRSSARETATRVAAGAIARKIVPGMTVRGALVQMGPHRIDRDKWDWDEIGRNPFFCPDKDRAAFFEEYLDGIRKNGSSIGAVIEVVAEGVPAGLGAPIYAKLDGDLAAALMSINAVKILSGVFEDASTKGQVTTGTPIALLIENVDQRSKDYSDIKDKYRPGHADYTYDVKYGLRDYRGGGRSSARETACRVAAGAVARKIVPGMLVRAALVQMGPHKIDRGN